MPGHVWKFIFFSVPIALGNCFLLGWFDRCWVFADEAGIQQDPIWAQDGCDHLQDVRVLGQVHHPWILEVSIVKAVLRVLSTWIYV